MKFNYAERMFNLKASEIREILKVTQRPEIISFSGGLPAPELFPLEAIKEVNCESPTYLAAKRCT
jgi:2-aminoadipate transaminase